MIVSIIIVESLSLKFGKESGSRVDGPKITGLAIKE